MKVKEIRIEKFKRFTDTTVADIPDSTKLVMLVGPNGCGKSSLIEAVHTWHRHHGARSANWDNTYHNKQLPGVSGNRNNCVTVTFHDPQPKSEGEQKKAVYVRSAYRNEAEFEYSTLSRVEPAVNEFRISRLIENDQAVSGNYRRLVSLGFEDVYERAKPDLTIGEFREQSIGEIRDAIQRLFPGLILNSLGNPLSNGTFRFDKGDSQGFLYKNLSGGEKAAFDLVLDLLIKRREFDDTVFFIDEPEAHMSPRLQSALLDELLDIVPENSQLWLATHSISMMRRARDIAHDAPDSVVFIDFDSVDFDLQTTLRPIRPSRPFWKRAMHIALDDLVGFVTPEHVVLCEGAHLQGGGDFDAECYNAVFQDGFPSVMFIGAGNSDDIENDPRGVERLLRALAPDVRVTRLMDRDDRTDDEIKKLLAKGIRVLSSRTIESYLLDDLVLRSLCETLGNPELADNLIEQKMQALQNSVNKGGPQDDLKRPAGDIYNAAKKLFPDRKLGSDKRAFMRAFCVPQLKPQMPIYESLRDEIFGRVARSDRREGRGG